MEDGSGVMTPRKLNRTVGTRRGLTLQISAIAGPIHDPSHEALHTVVPVRFNSVIGQALQARQEIPAATATAGVNNSVGQPQTGAVKGFITLWVPVPVPKLVAAMRAFQAEVLPLRLPRC